MTVYFVLSECFESGGSYEPPEPPDWGCIALIVVAESRSKAKYMAASYDKATSGKKPMDWPLFAIRKIGEAEGPSRVMDDAEAHGWWLRVPPIDAPLRKPTRFNAADVAILGGDPSL